MMDCLYACLLEAHLEKYHHNFQLHGLTQCQSLTALQMHDYAKFGIISMADRVRLFKLIQIIKSVQGEGLYCRHERGDGCHALQRLNPQLHPEPDRSMKVMQVVSPHIQQRSAPKTDPVITPEDSNKSTGRQTAGINQVLLSGTTGYKQPLHQPRKVTNNKKKNPDTVQQVEFNPSTDLPIFRCRKVLSFDDSDLDSSEVTSDDENDKDHTQGPRSSLPIPASVNGVTTEPGRLQQQLGLFPSTYNNPSSSGKEATVASAESACWIAEPDISELAKQRISPEKFYTGPGNSEAFNHIQVSSGLEYKLFGDVNENHLTEFSSSVAGDTAVDLDLYMPRALQLLEAEERLACINPNPSGAASKQLHEAPDLVRSKQQQGHILSVSKPTASGTNAGSLVSEPLGSSSLQLETSNHAVALRPEITTTSTSEISHMPPSATFSKQVPDAAVTSMDVKLCYQAGSLSPLDGATNSMLLSNATTDSGIESHRSREPSAERTHELTPDLYMQSVLTHSVGSASKRPLNSSQEGTQSNLDGYFLDQKGNSDTSAVSLTNISKDSVAAKRLFETVEEQRKISFAVNQDPHRNIDNTCFNNMSSQVVLSKTLPAGVISETARSSGQTKARSLNDLTSQELESYLYSSGTRHSGDVDTKTVPYISSHGVSASEGLSRDKTEANHSRYLNGPRHTVIEGNISETSSDPTTMGSVTRHGGSYAFSSSPKSGKQSIQNSVPQQTIVQRVVCSGYNYGIPSKGNNSPARQSRASPSKNNAGSLSKVTSRSPSKRTSGNTYTCTSKLNSKSPPKLTTCSPSKLISGTPSKLMSVSASKQTYGNPSKLASGSPSKLTGKQADLSSKTSIDADLDEPIRVCVRKRPLTKREVKKKEVDVVSAQGHRTVVVEESKLAVNMSKYTQQHLFMFDAVFSASCSNQEVYAQTAKPLVQHTLSGGSATCFAFGQTGAGKTYTLLGNRTMPGLYVLAGRDLCTQLAAGQPQSDLRLWLSYYEIYCGQLYDLLNNRKKLFVRENGRQQVCIAGLMETQVTNSQQLTQAVEYGNGSRSTGSTGVNASSSRSHAVLQLEIRNAREKKVGRLSFIDLAGSERAADVTDFDRNTRREGAEINQSLLALKECIRSLDQSAAHTPYRQSKLTHILRESFQGNSRTCMIANISPSQVSCENTLNTLRYAHRVKDMGSSSNAAELPSPIQTPATQTAAMMFPTLFHPSAISLSSTPKSKSQGIKHAPADMSPLLSEASETPIRGHQLHKWESRSKRQKKFNQERRMELDDLTSNQERVHSNISLDCATRRYVMHSSKNTHTGSPVEDDVIYNDALRRSKSAEAVACGPRKELFPRSMSVEGMYAADGMQLLENVDEPFSSARTSVVKNSLASTGTSDTYAKSKELIKIPGPASKTKSPYSMTDGKYNTSLVSNMELLTEHQEIMGHLDDILVKVKGVVAKSPVKAAAACESIISQTSPETVHKNFQEEVMMDYQHISTENSNLDSNAPLASDVFEKSSVSHRSPISQTPKKSPLYDGICQDAVGKSSTSDTSAVFSVIDQLHGLSRDDYSQSPADCGQSEGQSSGAVSQVHYNKDIFSPEQENQPKSERTRSGLIQVLEAERESLIKAFSNCDMISNPLLKSQDNQAAKEDMNVIYNSAGDLAVQRQTGVPMSSSTSVMSFSSGLGSSSCSQAPVSSNQNSINRSTCEELTRDDLGSSLLLRTPVTGADREQDTKTLIQSLNKKLTEQLLESHSPDSLFPTNHSPFGNNAKPNGNTPSPHGEKKHVHFAASVEHIKNSGTTCRLDTKPLDEKYTVSDKYDIKKTNTTYRQPELVGRNLMDMPTVSGHLEKATGSEVISELQIGLDALDKFKTSEGVTSTNLPMDNEFITDGKSPGNTRSETGLFSLDIKNTSSVVYKKILLDKEHNKKPFINSGKDSEQKIKPDVSTQVLEQEQPLQGLKTEILSNGRKAAFVQMTKPVTSPLDERKLHLIQEAAGFSPIHPQPVSAKQTHSITAPSIITKTVIGMSTPPKTQMCAPTQVVSIHKKAVCSVINPAQQEMEKIDSVLDIIKPRCPQATFDKDVNLAGDDAKDIVLRQSQLTRDIITQDRLDIPGRESTEKTIKGSGADKKNLDHLIVCHEEQLANMTALCRQEMALLLRVKTGEVDFVPYVSGLHELLAMKAECLSTLGSHLQDLTSKSAP